METELNCRYCQDEVNENVLVTLPRNPKAAIIAHIAIINQINSLIIQCDMLRNLNTKDLPTTAVINVITQPYDIPISDFWSHTSIGNDLERVSFLATDISKF